MGQETIQIHFLKIHIEQIHSSQPELVAQRLEQMAGALRREFYKYISNYNHQEHIPTRERIQLRNEHEYNQWAKHRPYKPRRN